MTAETPTLLALDFDGVICDGLKEYFQAAWLTYCEIWHPPSPTPPTHLAPRFNRLRPVIETGWEMPVLLQVLLKGISEEKILQDWSTLAQEVLEESNLKATEIAVKLDLVRDKWITTDLADWLGQHRFYPGVVEKLQTLTSSPGKLVIITTKEGRFVQQLLGQQNIKIPQNTIFGKEVKRPKYQILQELLTMPLNSWENQSPNFSQVSIWFVEDRLKTLQLVKQQKDLDTVRLYLADWGYNTPAEREAADQDARIQRLSLSLFAQDFETWP